MSPNITDDVPAPPSPTRRFGDGALPVPTHGHPDRTASLRLHLASGIWFCFACSPITADGTPQGADVIDWVRRTEGVGIGEAIRLLDSSATFTNAWAGTALTTGEPRRRQRTGKRPSLSAHHRSGYRRHCRQRGRSTRPDRSTSKVSTTWRVAGSPSPSSSVAPAGPRSATRAPVETTSSERSRPGASPTTSSSTPAGRPPPRRTAHHRLLPPAGPHPDPLCRRPDHRAHRSQRRRPPVPEIQEPAPHPSLRQVGQRGQGRGDVDVLSGWRAGKPGRHHLL